MMKGSSSREKKVILTVMIAALCFVGSAAQAATVSYVMDIGDGTTGTFTLTANVSTGDNFGLAFYNIPLVNILTATDNSPMGLDMDLGFLGRGFTGNGANLSGPGSLFASQNTGGTAPGILYGIGQTAGSYNVFTSAANKGVPWVAPVLLATGTYDTAGSDPAFGAAGDVKANVFLIEWLSGSVPEGVVGAASTTTQVIVIPEPATMVVLALGVGMMAMLRRRRRLN